MKVRMITSVSGTRNGQDWPPFGSIVNVPELEGNRLIAGGIARSLDHEDERDMAKRFGTGTVVDFEKTDAELVKANEAAERKANSGR